jgi:hypothetical protein
MKQPFHSLLADFLKTAGLAMELPSPEDLESFEFELEGMPCVVFPNPEDTAAVARVFIWRLDSLPAVRQFTAMRMLHSLNHQTCLESQIMATIDVDDRILLSKVIDTRHATGDQLAADIALLFEAAADLRRSLDLLASDGESESTLPATESVTPHPLHFA